MQLYLLMIDQFLYNLIQYFKNQPISKAWIFGSFSRNEATLDSDIDLMVSFVRDAKVGLFKYNQIKEDLEVLTGRKIDLVTESSLMPFAKESAMNDRILIYERKN